MLISECGAVSLFGGSFVEGTQAEKTISRVLPQHFYQTDLWLLICWGTTPRGLLYFFLPAPVMSCLFPLSCFVRWRPLFTARAAMRHGGSFFLTHRPVLHLPGGQSNVTWVRGGGGHNERLIEIYLQYTADWIKAQFPPPRWNTSGNKRPTEEAVGICCSQLERLHRV